MYELRRARAAVEAARLEVERAMAAAAGLKCGDQLSGAVKSSRCFGWAPTASWCASSTNDFL